MSSDEDSVGRSTYEGLVRLTYLCGRGLEPAELVRRFLVAMRAKVPASGMWIFQGDRLLAEDAVEGAKRPAAPGVVPPGLAPQVEASGEIVVPVLPGMVMVCRLADGPVQRASDVVSLVARIIALAWQAELVSRDEPWDDDYQQAKLTFKRRWLRSLLKRHQGRVILAARAAGMARTSFYTMMAQAGVRTDERQAEEDPAL